MNTGLLIDMDGVIYRGSQLIPGADRFIETLKRAVNLIMAGAKLIATNLDPNCPTKTGTRPGCGATIAYLEAVTGIKAFGGGKPSPIMMRAARKQLGLQTSQTVMIADLLDTNRFLAVNLPAGNQEEDTVTSLEALRAAQLVE
jgi:ribonucleotide monophosphatase NagD (HAD superfamily)